MLLLEVLSSLWQEINQWN